MKIAYLTIEEAELAQSKTCTLGVYLVVAADDVTGEYYSTEESIGYITELDMILFKFKPLVPLPEHEYYKFKIPQP
jgi:hypothetical protein